MEDSLSLLREFTKRGETVLLDGNEIVFGSVARFPRSTKTTFHSKGGKGDPYALDAVWFMLQHAESSIAEYFLACSKQKIDRVSVVDKKEMLAYLRGEIDTSAYIKDLPLPTTATLKRLGDESEDPSQRKKPRTLDDAHDGEPMALESSTGGGDMGKEDSSGVAGELGSLDGDASTSFSLERVLGRERSLCTRLSILSATKADFRDLIGLLGRAKATEEREAKQAKVRKEMERDKKRTRDRYMDEEHTNTGEFHIDTRGTFARPENEDNQNGGGVDSSSSSSSSSSSMGGVTSIASNPRGPPPSLSGPRSAITGARHSHQSHESHVPIIVVPAAVTAVLTLYNAKQFLEDGFFISSLEAKSSSKRKQPMLRIHRKRQGVPPAEYHVVDSVKRLKSKDWRRVVAVFVQGPSWQFKGWKWPSPVETFARVRGFYLCFEGDVIPETVKSWDVLVLKISKNKRHMDVTALAQFWQQLDAFIPKRNSSLVH